jgi:ATP-binding cassette subfamily B multidrug efflux pump
MNQVSTFKRLWQDIGPNKKYAIWGLIFYVPVTLLNIIQPIIIGFGVQKSLATRNASDIIFYFVAFQSVVLLLATCEYWQSFSLVMTGQRLIQSLRQQSFAKVQRLTMGFLDSTPMGKLLTRLTNDPESVAEMFSMGAIQIAGDLLFLLGTFIMLLMVNAQLTLYSACALPLLALGIYIFRRLTRLAFKKVRESLSNLNAFLQEYLSGNATLQQSDRLENSREDFTLYNQNYFAENLRAVFLEAAIYSFVDAMSYVTMALVLWGAFSMQAADGLKLGVLVAFIEALSRFFQPLKELSNRYTIFESALVSLERIYELLGWPEEPRTSNPQMLAFSDEIQFKNVSFAYKNTPVLHDVSFTIKKGERVAIVGHTGAGKSTVIKLINRFYDVTSGAIMIDGRNINDIPLDDLRKLITVVPQEVFLFKGNLRDNLAFGKTAASDEELWHALRIVQLEDLVRDKGGLYCEVGSKGQNFSLGERQLLAMARALVADPPILILDEATASIDVRTEHRLQHATVEILKNRTALVIAHRLSTIMDADRILVFHRGQIVEEGNHESLMTRNGVYAGLTKLQQQGERI